MNCRVSDDAFPFVSFSFSGFKLRFYQGEDFT